MNQPIISSFSPTSGVAGSSVVLSGSNLSQVLGVEFNGTPAAFVIDSDTQITATVPNGASSGRVTVTAPGVISSGDYFQVGGSTATQGGGDSATATNQDEQTAILQYLRNEIATFSIAQLPLPDRAATEDSLQELKDLLLQIIEALGYIIARQSQTIFPILTHKVLVEANVEYSCNVSLSRKFIFQTLNGADLRYSYNSGFVASSTLPYYLLRGGTEEVEDWSPDFFSGTIYFASDIPNTIVLVKAYSENS